MNVFEELIDELKEEDLLEETVFSLKRSSETGPERPGIATAAADLIASDADDDEDFPSEAADGIEAARRRAMEEVSSLQMVEHIISTVEREHMKMAAKAFDDLDVKKALHKYLQLNSGNPIEERADAEAALYGETEKWFSHLSERDNNITVANIRRFCENSKPALSSQALIALARFYRNSPYNESVRGKFDFVMTKLFSRDIEDEKRRLLFGRIETLHHVQTLYSNWSSLSISEDGDETGPVIAPLVSGFEEFGREAETASSFEDLIGSGFFNRIRMFKENCAEIFFEPAVVAAAMECNVRIGNRFIDLVRSEREASRETLLEEKYGYSYDAVVSGAASKTLLLLDLLRGNDLGPDIPAPSDKPAKTAKVDFERAPVTERASRFRVNKWLLAAAVLLLGLSSGLYFWSENAASAEQGVEVAPTVNVSGTELAQYIKEASTSNETLYGVLQPSWSNLSEDDQKLFLSKAYGFAKNNGMNKVNLLNDRGRTVGFASAERLEIFTTP